MEKVVFTALTKQDLEALVIDCVQVCLKRHAAQRPEKWDATPEQAGEVFVSKKQAARLLDCSQSTIDNFARSGRLTRSYVGKAVRFDRQQVLSLAQNPANRKRKTN